MGLAGAFVTLPFSGELLDRYSWVLVEWQSLSIVTYSMVSLPDFSRQFQTHESSRQLWLNSVDYRVNQKDRNVRKGFA